MTGSLEENGTRAEMNARSANVTPQSLGGWRHLNFKSGLFPELAHHAMDQPLEISGRPVHFLIRIVSDSK